MIVAASRHAFRAATGQAIIPPQNGHDVTVSLLVRLAAADGDPKTAVRIRPVERPARG